MKVLSAEFVRSAVEPRDMPRDGLPHVALVGRSNVGKSTLINALAGRRIAHTSAQPGKTRLANLYRVHAQAGRPDASGAPAAWRFYFADLPGYGYAKGGKAALDQFARVAGAYFGEMGTFTFSPEKAGEKVSVPISLLHIVDARHPGLDADQAARDWIATLGVPHAIVATKIDKLSRNERARSTRELERLMNAPVLPVSAVSGEGLEDLWTHILKLLASR